MSKRTIPAFAAAALLALAPAFAQTEGNNSGTSQTGHGAHGSTVESKDKGQASQDERFMRDAAAGGMMEVELGRLAAERAASADVKAFGQRMVTDHSKANQQLMQLATSKGMTLPRELPADMQAQRDKLARLSGAEFDRMYMQHMVKDHKKDVAEFEKQAEKGADAALRTFAQETLPTLREHLTLAESLAGKNTR
jgi:putative membrane protein